MPGWPRLAWVVELRYGDYPVIVRCGEGVECRDGWFCEAVWDGAFSEGRFDATDVVFGSGARLEAGALVLVSSGTTVDRLQWVEKAGRIFVSNSLVTLSHCAELEFDPSLTRYLGIFLSIVDGIGQYQRALPCGEHTVNLCYFHNLRWDGHALVEVEKPHSRQDFGCFDDYHAFLRDTVQAVFDNGRDPARRHPFKPLGTLSTGYDSTCVSVLGAAAGMQEVIGFTRPGGRDSGAELAERLGLEYRAVDIDRWRELDRPEPEFMASDAVGAEVHFSPLAGELSGRLLLTGYHGDKVWDFAPASGSPDLVRGDLSGLSLTEFRLRAGFLHGAVPFLGARRLAQVIRISQSPEMAPWHIDGSYSRPIPRRIAESAGLPRESFGRVKSFASRWFLAKADFMTELSSADYRFWLSGGNPRGRRLHGARTAGKVAATQLGLAHRVVDVLGLLPGVHRLGLLKRWPLKRLTDLSFEDIHAPPWLPRSRLLVFPWAIDRAMRKLKDNRASGNSPDPDVEGVSSAQAVAEARRVRFK